MVKVNKKILRVINLAIILIALFTSYISMAEVGNDVYVIPIKGNITKATYQFVESKVNEVKDLNPKAIIFEIDTYGGYIQEAEKIWRLISDLEVPTISYVNTKAESAGVLITISSDKIVMAEGSTIGSAETRPSDEKTLSMWVSWLREAAQNKGRDPQLVAAMADKDIEIPGVIEEGKLLNLNSNKAESLGFTDLVTDSFSNILDYFNIQYDEIKEYEATLRVKAAGLLTDPYVGTVLITLGFIGLVVELLAPGFGAGGTLSLIAFTLFFGGNVLAGNTGWGVLMLFVLGIVLLIIEAAIPGFGIPGIGGMLCVFASIVFAMNSITTAIISLLIAIVLAITVAGLMIKYGYKSPYLDRIILGTNQDKESGYVGLSFKDKYLGAEGEVVSYLRPSGTVKIGSERVDAVSEGEFIKKGEKVKVIKVSGMRVIVRKIN